MMQLNQHEKEHEARRYTIPNPNSERVTPDEWLRGYFNSFECDRKGGRSVSTLKRKNFDYLRLRDVPLHLLEVGPGRTIMDVGCANGGTMVYCGLQGAAVYGRGSLFRIREACERAAPTLQARRRSRRCRRSEAPVPR